jgi:hypothetical protein
LEKKKGKRLPASAKIKNYCKGASNNGPQIAQSKSGTSLIMEPVPIVPPVQPLRSVQNLTAVQSSPFRFNVRTVQKFEKSCPESIELFKGSMLEAS